MPKLSRGVLAAAAITLFPALPAAASAAVSVEQSGSHLTVTASGPSDSGEVNLNTYSTSPDDLGPATFYLDSTGLGPIVSSSCEVSEDENIVYCAGGLTGISIDVSQTTGGASVSLGKDIVADDVEPPVQVQGSDDADWVSTDREATYGVSFTGAGGDDTAQLGFGDDAFIGGDGNDRFLSSPGDDLFQGGAGNDILETGDAPDGADLFEGGSDDGAGDSRLRGDAVLYTDRTTPVTVRLAATNADGPTTGGGAAGENDGFLGVESAEGGSAADALYGNDAANELLGRDGNDLIAGGDGDDTLFGEGGADDVRGEGGNDLLAVRYGSDDVDAALSCGDGTDRIIRDATDPAHSGCETDAPGFASTVSITGSVNVGSTLTATGLQTYGDAGTVSAGWVTCGTVEFDDCKEVGTGTSYVLQSADLGRFVYAYASVSDATGETDQTATDLTAAVKAALPAPAGPTPAVTPAATPVPPFAARAAQTAVKVLGGTPGIAKGFAPLGAGVQVFVQRKGDKPKALKLTGKKPAPVAAVVCETACKLKSSLSLTVTSKKTKKKTTLKLPGATLNAKPGEAAVVSAKLSAAAKKAIASSSSTPTLTVKLTIGEGKGKKTGSQKLKVAKP